jgi:CheY-like chemotaxis protein
VPLSVRLLCVGRHRFLADHLCEFFRDGDVETACAVGVAEAIERARALAPDVVVCDYDLLATIPLRSWERDPVLSHTPVVAVSLTRRPDEVHLLDINGIAGFLYLPALERADALRVVHAAARAAPLGGATQDDAPAAEPGRPAADRPVLPSVDDARLGRPVAG